MQSYRLAGEKSSFSQKISEDIIAHQEGIALQNLPNSFQGVISYTRAVGVQHLWIDRFCIIQDSETDTELSGVEFANKSPPKLCPRGQDHFPAIQDGSQSRRRLAL